MEIEEFVRALGINKDIVFENGVPTVFLDNSNEYAQVYTMLMMSDLVDLDQQSVVINPDVASLKCYGQEYNVTLSADLSRDVYKLTIDETM